MILCLMIEIAFCAAITKRVKRDLISHNRLGNTVTSHFFGRPSSVNYEIQILNKMLQYGQQDELAQIKSYWRKRKTKSRKLTKFGQMYVRHQIRKG